MTTLPFMVLACIAVWLLSGIARSKREEVDLFRDAVDSLRVMARSLYEIEHVARLLSVRGKAGLRINIENDPPNGTGGEYMGEPINVSVALNDRQHANIKLAPVDLDGQAFVNADGTPFVPSASWATNNEDVVPIAVAEDGQSATINSKLVGTGVVSLTFSLPSGDAQVVNFNCAVGNSGPAASAVSVTVEDDA